MQLHPSQWWGGWRTVAEQQPAINCLSEAQHNHGNTLRNTALVFTTFSHSIGPS